MNGDPRGDYTEVSTTLEERLEWDNSTLLRRNVAQGVSRLRQQLGKDILVFGGDLVNARHRGGLRVMVPYPSPAGCLRLPRRPAHGSVPLERHATGKA